MDAIRCKLLQSRTPEFHPWDNRCWYVLHDIWLDRLFLLFHLTFTEVQLLPVAIVALNSSITPWWSLSAAALVSVAPLVLVAFIVERYLSKGNLSGALK